MGTSAILRRGRPRFTRTRRVGSEVVVANTVHMRGRQGIEVVARTALVFWVENEQIARLRLFQEQAEALEAVSLRETGPLLGLHIASPRTRAISLSLMASSLVVVWLGVALTR